MDQVNTCNVISACRHSDLYNMAACSRGSRKNAHHTDLAGVALCSHSPVKMEINVVTLVLTKVVIAILDNSLIFMIT